MLTLIKREINDNLIFYLAAIIAAMASIFIMVSLSVPLIKHEPPIGVPKFMHRTLWSLLPFLAVAAAALGSTQMYIDKGKRISTFLSTLATSRTRILAARIIAGLAFILLVLLPIAAVDMILLNIFPRLMPVDMSFLVNVFIVTFLSALLGYSVGLQSGWNSNKLFPTLGSIAITPLLLTVIIIKGFGVETMVILLLLTVAMLIRTWQKFLSTAL